MYVVLYFHNFIFLKTVNDGGDDVMINGYFGALAISNGLYQPSPESFIHCPPMMLRMNYTHCFHVIIVIIMMIIVMIKKEEILLPSISYLDMGIL